MEFRVHTSEQVEVFYHGDSTYKIGDGNGVLEVVDEENKVTVYSPCAWVQLTESEPRPEPTAF